jgi:Type I 3-dehydroquinase
LYPGFSKPLSISALPFDSLRYLFLPFALSSFVNQSLFQLKLDFVTYRIGKEREREMAVGRTLLCVSSIAKTVEEMVGDMAAAAAMGADVVELRLDHLSSFQPRSDLERLLTNRSLPVLVTYRSLSL